MTEKPLRRPALNQVVRDHIIGFILSHKLEAGDPLPPETQLAQDLGVGRSSVREAIKALQSLGIVEVRHGEGLYVREYNFDPMLEALSYSIRSDPLHLAELMQIRMWLETAVIGDAVKQIGPDELAALDAVLQEWAGRLEADEPHVDLDERFHCILYGALGNETLLKLFEAFWIAFERQEIAVVQQSDPAEELVQHRAILEAVRAHDTALTRQRLLQHFRHLQDRIGQAIATT